MLHQVVAARSPRLVSRAFILAISFCLLAQPQASAGKPEPKIKTEKRVAGNGSAPPQTRTSQPASVAAPRQALKSVKSWGYQLQNVDPRSVPAKGTDLLVVDYSEDGTHAKAFTRNDVERLRKRDKQPARLVLAYLSIGEAEDYRFYWQAHWVKREPTATASILPLQIEQPPQRHRLTPQAPVWLGRENVDWPSNFLVRYWDRDWQTLIYGSSNAYLDKIIDAGFDGVYLDKIDSTYDWENYRASARREMVDFVKNLAVYARKRESAFLVVPQNGEELLQFTDYVTTIDAVAKEELLFGSSGRVAGEANPASEVKASVRYLDIARRAGKPVLAVEYLERSEQIHRARQRLRALGYVPLIANRELNERTSESEAVAAPTLPSEQPALSADPDGASPDGPAR